ncbi:short C-terminal domain protein [Rhodococcus sp. MTM3W5.2]|uniref:PLD nuclease N-terminal domain-containing protein n=1 Tax=Rhodococcus sp. MTM3W5.2 TaxID=1805827 RepID=UPI000979725C|nr:PLD nuclease N-terminal domain-containing protein [Rhodococcus sp. MTM3W5.2]AQA22904.1 short C-terminal domain protein [Rhodococcus sp. MTM3W5.2]
MNFWEGLGWMLWATVFIGYLLALFAIIADLFRDHRLNGWWKALWVFFLLFLPIVTALVYLVARGEGMTERSNKAARDAENAAESYIREVAGKSPSEEIAAAAALLESGAISDEEFTALKLKVLS